MKSVNVKIENRYVDGDENNKNNENVSDDSRTSINNINNDNNNSNNDNNNDNKNSINYNNTKNNYNDSNNNYNSNNDDNNNSSNDNNDNNNNNDDNNISNHIHVNDKLNTYHDHHDHDQPSSTSSLMYDVITEKLIPSKIIGKRIKIWNEHSLSYEEANVVEYIASRDRYRCEYIYYDDYYNEVEEEDLNHINSNFYWLDETVEESMIPKKKIVSYFSYDDNHDDNTFHNNNSNSSNIIMNKNDIDNNILTIDTTTIVGSVGTTIGSVETLSPLGSEEKSPLGIGHSTSSYLNHNQNQQLSGQQQQQQQQYMYPSIWYNERNTSEADKIQRFSIKLSYHMITILLQKHDELSTNCNDRGSSSTSSSGSSGCGSYSYGSSNHISSSGNQYGDYGGSGDVNCNNNNRSSSCSSNIMINAWLSLKNLLEEKFSLKVSVTVNWYHHFGDPQ